MLRCQFLCNVLKALFFIKIALKLSYFCKKLQNFRALRALPQDPPNSPPPLRISGYEPASTFKIHPPGAIHNATWISKILTPLILPQLENNTKSDLSNGQIFKSKEQREKFINLFVS